jgi:dephospho-CoA kinase
VHPLVREKMNIFLKKNKKQKAVVLDIPLFLENKLNLNTDILVFIDSKRSEIMKRLKKRTGFSLKIYNFLKKNQITVDKKNKLLTL